MPATAAFAVEPAPIIPPPPIEKEATVEETPPVMVAAPMSIDDIKQAILSLIQENNAEFKQFLDELMANKNASVVEKESKPTVEILPVEAVQKEPLHWSEMPFWKAHPDLKPIDPKPFAAKQGLYEAMMNFATNPETRLTDDLMVHELD